MTDAREQDQAVQRAGHNPKDHGRPHHGRCRTPAGNASRSDFTGMRITHLRA